MRHCASYQPKCVTTGAVFRLVIRHAVVHIEIVYYVMLSGLFKIAEMVNRMI